jgi:hypothetical protein
VVVPCRCFARELICHSSQRQGVVCSTRIGHVVRLLCGFVRARRPKMIAHAEQVPFRIPDILRQMLESMRLEFGTGCGVREHLPAEFVWSIRNDDNEVCGYCWLSSQSADPKDREYHVNFATFEDFRGCGVARIGLDSMEVKVSDLLQPKMYAQVNSNGEFGLIVRRWLLRRKYGVARDRLSERYKEMPDDLLAERYPNPLTFIKEIAHRNEGVVNPS